MANNDELVLQVGAEFKKGVQGELEVQLKAVGISAEVGAKISKAAMAELSKEIKELGTSLGKSGKAPIQIQAEIAAASRKAVDAWLSGLRKRKITAELGLSDASVKGLEKAFDGFGVKMAARISEEISKNLKIRIEDGAVSAKPIDEIERKAQSAKEALREMEREARKLSTTPVAKESTRAEAGALAGELDTAAASNDLDTLSAAAEQARKKLAALRMEATQFVEDYNAIATKSPGEALAKATGKYRDGSLNEPINSALAQRSAEIFGGYDTAGAEEKVRMWAQWRAAADEYAEQVRQATQAEREIQKIETNLSRAEGYEKKYAGVGEVETRIAEYRKGAEALRSALSDVIQTGRGMDTLSGDITQSTEAFGRAENAAKEYETSLEEVRLASRRSGLTSDIDTFLRENPHVAENEAMASRLNAIRAAIGDAGMPQMDILTSQFRQAKAEAQSAGLTMQTFGDRVRGAFQKFTGWLTVSRVVMTAIEVMRKYGAQLVEVDTYLTEISKTSEMTAAQLAKMGEEAYDSARKYGQTVQSYLEGVQEMSRAGYNRQGQAEAMSELSLTTQAAGDVSAEIANKFLIASDAAYRLGGNMDALTAIVDGANGITNRYAVNLTDIASGMSIAGASAAQFGVKADQLAAAIGTMNAVTQLGGETSARAMRYMLSVLSKTSGEIDGEIIDTEGLEKAEAALAAIGVRTSEARDGIVALRDPMEIIRETAQALSQMDEKDARRSEVLNALGGVNRQASVAALLSNFEMYESMLETYASSAGSAAAEAMKTAESIQGRINNIATTIVSILDNIASSGTIKGVLSGLQGILSIIEEITGVLSDAGNLAGMAGLGASLFGNIGREMPLIPATE